MYSEEIEKFIKERNYLIGGEDLIFLIDVDNHPQITEVKFNAGDNTYDITTDDNYYFHFTAKKINQDEKKLVRKP